MFKKKISILCSDPYHFIISFSHVCECVGVCVPCVNVMGAELENVNENLRRAALMTQKELKLKVTLRTVCFWNPANFSADCVDSFFHYDEHSTRCVLRRMRTMTTRDTEHTHSLSLSFSLISSRIAWGAQAPGTCMCIMWVAMTHDKQDQHRVCVCVGEWRIESLLWRRVEGRNKSVEKLIVIF